MSDFWRELRTPDANERDWYGELNNQRSHILLGIEAATLWCILSFVLFGEMPYKTVVIGVVGLCYLMIEAVVQGWKAGDSWFDMLMVMCGTGAIMLPFSEVSVAPWVVRLDFEPGIFAALCLVCYASLVARVARRYRASRRSQTWM